MYRAVSLYRCYSLVLRVHILATKHGKGKELFEHGLSNSYHMTGEN